MNGGGVFDALFVQGSAQVVTPQSCEKRRKGQKRRQQDAERLRGPKRVKFWGPKGDAPGVTLRTTR